MSTTTNLAIKLIAAAQNQKEVTFGEAVNRIEDAITENLALSVAAGNAAPTQEQVRAAAILQISGATTAGRTVTWPTVKRPFFAALDAASTQAVSIVRGTKSVSIYPGCSMHLYADGGANGLLPLAEYGPVRTAHWVRGVTDDNEIVVRWQVQQDSVLLPALLGWDVQADTAADAETIFQVRRNGSEVGTITFAAAGTVPTLATAGGTAQAFAAGDFIDVKGPVTADATLAGIFFHIMLVRA